MDSGSASARVTAGILRVVSARGAGEETGAASPAGRLFSAAGILAEGRTGSPAGELQPVVRPFSSWIYMSSFL
ncbi:MAG: hypothetical protein FWE19_05690 [Oscillospiraceae bacterium]|nr:hypothetical protein [Oscillospiraceae bacterium]